MWNYRILRKREKNCDSDYYALVEVYYDDDGTPVAHLDHDEVVGEDPEDIRARLVRMLGDAQDEIEHKLYLDEADFEKGGKYSEASGKWFADLVGDTLERVEGKHAKGQSPEEARITLDHWFRKFEVERKEDHYKTVVKVVKAFADRLDDKGNYDGNVGNYLREIAEETYEPYKDDDEPEAEVIEVDKETQEKMDKVVEVASEKITDPKPPYGDQVDKPFEFKPGKKWKKI